MSKTQRVNIHVLSDHGQYINLLLLPKLTAEDAVKLFPEKKGRLNMEVGQAEFQHMSSDMGYLQCRQNSVEKMRYSFQLFVKSFMADPVFRFDAVGGRHSNPKDKSSGLVEKSIKTPHFQKFNSQGISIAYRTDFLEDNQDEILNDINLGLDEFCQECSLSTNSGSKLVVLRQLALFPILPDADPHNNITFA